MSRRKRGRSELSSTLAEEVARRASVEVNYFTAKKVSKKEDALNSLRPTQLYSFPHETEAIATLAKSGEKYIVKKVQQKARLAYRALHEKWLLYFWAGYNILVVGIGSKQVVLKDFMQAKLTDPKSALVEINGFSPAVRHGDIINTILRDVLDTTARFTSYSAKVDHIAHFFSEANTANSRPRRLFIVIHNIDGQHLRKVNVQTLLSVLASASRIHIIASVDHIRHKLLWNQQLLQRFNFVWQYTPTFQAFKEEALQQSYELGSLSTSRHTVQGTLHVLQSVTANHRSLWRIVARRQLQQHTDEEEEASQSTESGRRHSSRSRSSKSSSKGGIEFQELVEESRQGFFVRNFRILTQQIKELVVHRLLDQRLTQNGVRLYYVPERSNETIRNVLEAIQDC